MARVTCEFASWLPVDCMQFSRYMSWIGVSLRWSWRWELSRLNWWQSMEHFETDIFEIFTEPPAVWNPLKINDLSQCYFRKRLCDIYKYRKHFQIHRKILLFSKVPFKSINNRNDSIWTTFFLASEPLSTCLPFDCDYCYSTWREQTPQEFPIILIISEQQQIIATVNPFMANRKEKKIDEKTRNRTETVAKSSAVRANSECSGRTALLTATSRPFVVAHENVISNEIDYFVF